MNEIFANVLNVEELRAGLIKVLEARCMTLNRLSKEIGLSLGCLHGLLYRTKEPHIDKLFVIKKYIKQELDKISEN